MKFALKSKKLIFPLQEIKDAVILINEDKIEEAGKQENIKIPEGYEIKDLALKPG